MDNAKIHHGQEILDLVDEFGMSVVSKLNMLKSDNFQVSESSTFRRIRQTSILLRRRSPKSSIGFVDIRIITKLPREPPSFTTCGKFSTSSLRRMQLVIFSMRATFSFYLFLKRTSFICMPAALQWIDAIIQYDVMELPTKFDC